MIALEVFLISIAVVVHLTGLVVLTTWAYSIGSDKVLSVHFFGHGWRWPKVEWSDR